MAIVLENAGDHRIFPFVGQIGNSLSQCLSLSDLHQKLDAERSTDTIFVDRVMQAGHDAQARPLGSYLATAVRFGSYRRF
jgi:hypothetical protein